MGLESTTSTVSWLLATAAEQEAAKPSMVDRLARGAIESGVFVVIGIVAFLLAFVLITKIAPFSIRREIEEDQNTALGIVIGAVMIGLAIIIAAAIG